MIILLEVEFYNKLLLSMVSFHDIVNPAIDVHQQYEI